MSDLYLSVESEGIMQTCCTFLKVAEVQSVLIFNHLATSLFML